MFLTTLNVGIGSEQMLASKTILLIAGYGYYHTAWAPASDAAQSHTSCPTNTTHCN